MALSALWRRSASWRSALTRLVQLFRSPQSSGPKGSANLPPPAPLASSPGVALPPTARGGPQGSGKPLAGADQSAPRGQLQPYGHQGRAVAPVPPARHTQGSPASSANTSGTPLGSGSPPDGSTPMDVDVTPALNISLASDVSMEEDAPRGCDLSLATDVSMEEDTPRGCDLSLASDVAMEEDTPRGCDLSLASDVAMEEDTSPPRPTTASHSAALQVQAIRDPGVTPASRALPRGKVLPKGTQGHLGCSPGAAGTSQDHGSSVPVPTDRGGTSSTSGTSPQHKIPSLCPPKKMPQKACSVPKPSQAVLSTGHGHAIGTKPQDSQQHVGTDLPPPQSSVPPHDTKLERRGTKRKRGSEPGAASKIKAPAAGAGAERLA
ncbi:nascent polypeptide-associated complex subunit alpha, muscle-specific form-like [Pseudopipra pipra]|uniref:nascent polypeptide-associated complex subunit alpha, muscle-specific form-like n=1 Tax=Pseudopipra pipra TaxID=415032 RepID=UPI0031393916